MFTLQSKSDLPLCLTTHHALFLTHAHDIFLISLNIFVLNSTLAPSLVPFTHIGFYVICKIQDCVQVSSTAGGRGKNPWQLLGFKNASIYPSIHPCTESKEKHSNIPLPVCQKRKAFQNRKHLNLCKHKRPLRGWVSVNSFPTSIRTPKHTVSISKKWHASDTLVLRQIYQNEWPHSKALNFLQKSNMIFNRSERNKTRYQNCNETQYSEQ